MNINIFKFMNEEDIKNFNTALSLYQNDYPHQNLIEMLKSGSIVEKQIAAIKLEYINSQNDADALISNLTGQDGKIREAVSFKIREFMNNQNYLKYFYSTKSYDTFLGAIIDINGNICRNIISAISNLKTNNEFCKHFCPKLTNLTLQLANKACTFDLQDGKYKVNKEIFKLYWCLETLYIFYDKVDMTILKSILLKTKSVQDYTIREKTAKILSKNFQDNDLIKLREELKKDKNYYVRRF